MSRINVLWVIDHVCYDGTLHGGGRLYWNVLPRFDADRFRIVPCMLRADDEIRELFMDSPAPVRILDKGKYDPTTLWTFLRLISDEEIHVLHLHCYGASTFGRLTGLLTGVPTIIHDYDTAVYFPYPWYLWIADRVLSPMTRRAIAASPMVRDFFIKQRKIAKSKIDLAFHAIPAGKFSGVSVDEINKTKESLRIDGGVKIVGTVTKIGPQRGNKIFLKAAAEVLKSSPNTIFILIYKPTQFHRPPDSRYLGNEQVNDEAQVADLETLVEELGIKGAVRLIQSPGNVDELVAAFDLFVAPFLSARFSSVNLLEAMAMRKTIIATDLGDSREIIVDGINGYLVPVGDIESLANKILEALDQPQELEHLGSKARETAEQYSVDAYVEWLQDIYAALSADSKARNRHIRG